MNSAEPGTQAVAATGGIRSGGRPTGMVAHGVVIRMARAELCMTQEEVAAAAGITVRTLSSAERGRRVSRATLVRLARVLGLGVDDVVEPAPQGGVPAMRAAPALAAA